MEILVLLFLVGALIMVPLLILGAFLKVVAAIVFLPFKIMAVLFKGLFGITIMASTYTCFLRLSSWRMILTRLA